MPPIKLDFALEGIDIHQDAAAVAKPGTPVHFGPGETDAQLFVVDQTGSKLGRVPALLQQALLADSFTATIRSFRRHEGKVTELTVRAIANGEQQASAQQPGRFAQFCPKQSLVPCSADICSGTHNKLL